MEICTGVEIGLTGYFTAHFVWSFVVKCSFEAGIDFVNLQVVVNSVTIIIVCVFLNFSDLDPVQLESICSQCNSLMIPGSGVSVCIRSKMDARDRRLARVSKKRKETANEPATTGGQSLNESLFKYLSGTPSTAHTEQTVQTRPVRC